MALRAPRGQMQGSATTAMLRHRRGAMTRLSAAAVALRPAAERSKPGAGNGPSAENNSPPPSARRAPLKQSLSVALLVSALLALSCASKTGPARGTGTKVLERVVV